MRPRCTSDPPQEEPPRGIPAVDPLNHQHHHIGGRLFERSADNTRRSSFADQEERMKQSISYTAAPLWGQQPQGTETWREDRSAHSVCGNSAAAVQPTSMTSSWAIPPPSAPQQQEWNAENNLNSMAFSKSWVPPPGPAQWGNNGLLPSSKDPVLASCLEPKGNNQESSQYRFKDNWS